MRSLVCSLLVLVLAAPLVAARAQDAAGYVGTPAAVEVLDELRDAGRAARVQQQSRAAQACASRRSRAHGAACSRARAARAARAGDPRDRRLMARRARRAGCRGAQAPGGVAVAAVVAASATPIAGRRRAARRPDGPSLALVAGRAAFAGRRRRAGTRSPCARRDILPGARGVDVRPGATADLAIELVAAAPPLEELTVTASRYDLRNEVQPSSSYFSQEQIESLAELGDDALRVAHRLPGIATNEFSSRSHVRGGAADEMTVILDGMKLFEPFHLRDYQSVFSAIDQRIVSGIEIYSGGFPVAYGDALSGLTVIDQLEPTERLQARARVEPALHVGVVQRARSPTDRAQWLVSAAAREHRRAAARRARRAVVSRRVRARRRHARLRSIKPRAQRHRLRRRHRSSRPSTLRTTASRRAQRNRQQPALAQGRQRLDARAVEPQPRLRDALHGRSHAAQWHDVDELARRRRRSARARGERRQARLGWDASGAPAAHVGIRSARSSRAATPTRARPTCAACSRRSSPSRAARARSRSLPQGESYGIYVSDRVRISDRVIAELGVRWDKQTYLPPADDEQFSPRGSLLYRVGARTDLRFSYGQVLSGREPDRPAGRGRRARFRAGAERVAFDRRASTIGSRAILRCASRCSASGRAMRVRASRTCSIRSCCCRSCAPAACEIAPERAESRGLEAMLNGNGAIEWWAGYSFARADGHRERRAHRAQLGSAARADAAASPMTSARGR